MAVGRRKVGPALLACWLSVTIGIGASEQQPAQAPAGTGRVIGRIVAAESGAVVRGARITLIGPKGAEWIATSDEDGRFDVGTLPAGSFMLRIAKAGFVAPPTANVALRDNQTLNRGDITLARGGVIIGRVTDRFGEPVVDATVGAARVSYRWPGDGMLINSANSRTNDLGEFRLYGLQAGTYLVHASFGTTLQLAMSGAGGEPQTTYVGAASSPALTFFPGTPRRNEAAPVTVSAGEQSYADIRLVSVPLATLSGQVLDSNGQPARSSVVMLGPAAGGAEFRLSGAELDAQGRFTITNVQPGEYRLDVIARSVLEATGQTGRAEAQPGSESASLRLSVERDVRDLLVHTSRRFDLRGRVTVDGASIPANWKSKLIVRASAPAGIGMSADVAPDGSFVLRGTGAHRFLTLTGLPPHAIVERITVQGIDITDESAAIEGDLVGAEIAVTTRPTVVTGQVTNERGEPLAAHVVVFTEDLRVLEKSAGRRYAAKIRSEPQKGFRISGLPPGRYFAATVLELDEWDWANPINFQRLRAAATPVTLAKGQTVELTLVLR